MRALCRNCAVFLMLCFVTCNAKATSFTTDQSDLWYIPSESGWGMQLVQRDSVIFATLFVYGQNNQPTWYVSTMNYTSNLTWTGPLYATTGPWFGTVPFNPQNVNAVQVGTMTWSAPFVESGTVAYSVNGVNVSKNVVRQVLVNDDFNGTFPGAVHMTYTNCSNSANNGTFEIYAAISVIQSGSSVTLGYANQAGGTCSFVGTFSQAGQFGKMVGNYSCSSGDNGTFNMFEMNAGFNSVTGRLTMASSNIGCKGDGYYGGIRHR